MTTVAFCEIDKKAQLVLKKHWPNVPVFEDVSTLTKELLDERGITIDVICGGFPCQDISYAGAGAGIEGERSGLWSEYARLIGELRPQFVIVENVSALLSRGLDRVLGDLASIGYDAEWHCIPASAVGAPHRRDRIWIMAYPSIVQQYGGNANTQAGSPQIPEFGNYSGPNVMAYATGEGLERQQRSQGQRQFVQSVSQAQIINRQAVVTFAGGFREFWRVEPRVGRVANGVPKRVDRLKQLGNAVVPQIPELIGRAILAKKDPHG
jgi:DNA (cytosine-5)-methyltransferase 1